MTGRRDQEESDRLLHVDDTSADTSTPLTVDFKKAATVSHTHFLHTVHLA